MSAMTRIVPSSPPPMIILDLRCELPAELDLKRVAVSVRCRTESSVSPLSSNMEAQTE